VKARRDGQGVAVTHHAQILVSRVGVVADLDRKAVRGMHPAVVALLERSLVGGLTVVAMRWERRPGARADVHGLTDDEPRRLVVGTEDGPNDPAPVVASDDRLGL